MMKKLSGFLLLVAVGVIFISAASVKQASYVPPNPTVIATKIASYVPPNPTMPQADPIAF
jgi:uncharacterized ion transporter superfamily protein YfcC